VHSDSPTRFSSPISANVLRITLEVAVSGSILPASLASPGRNSSS